MSNKNSAKAFVAHEGDEKHALPSEAHVSETPTESQGEKKLNFLQSVRREFLIPGSALQIISAALIAVAIGLIVSTQTDHVPDSASTIVNIPGDLWIRGLKATVLPLIICAMIKAIVEMREVGHGSGRKMAIWTFSYFLTTTCISTCTSVIMNAFVWRPLYTVMDQSELDISQSQESDAEDKAETAQDNPPHVVVQTLFQSFVPSNVFGVMADGELLGVLMAAVVLGILVRNKSGVFFRLIIELEDMVMRAIMVLIKLAPIGVFFLILSNLMTLNIAEIGSNLGILIGGTISTLFIHLFFSLPLIFFIVVRQNPYAYWLKNSPSWITAWGSASSAGTLPVTMRCCAERGIPTTVYRFVCPFGCLVNMDGSAIYLPMGVIFLASAQGQALNAANYVLIVVLAVVSSIGASPIPSSALVLIIMIADSVGIEVPGILFAVIVSIDWLLDRFRTMTNVSGDLYGAKIVYTMVGDMEADDTVDEDIIDARRDSAA